MRTIILFLSLIFLTNCDWEIISTSTSDAELPPVTITGEDTFGCKINGSIFTPKFSSFMTDQSLYAYGKFSKENGYFEISAINQDWKKKNSQCSGSWVELIFWLDSTKSIVPKAKLSFEYCGNEEEADNKYTPYKEYKGYIYLNSDEYNNFEIMNYDTTNQNRIILSIKFQGKIESQDGDIIKISKGRFDVTLD